MNHDLAGSNRTLAPFLIAMAVFLGLPTGFDIAMLRINASLLEKSIASKAIRYVASWKVVNHVDDRGESSERRPGLLIVAVGPRGLVRSV